MKVIWLKLGVPYRDRIGLHYSVVFIQIHKE
jgi:hypothetical protein